MGTSRQLLVPLLVAATLCSLFSIAAAIKLYPLIDGDGTAYFPPAVEWSRGRSLTNPVWLQPLNDSIDGPGGRRLIYHGFLYQLLVGRIGRAFGGGPEAAVKGAYVVHWLVAIVAAAAVLSWTHASGPARSALALVLPVSMLAISVAWHGRVEPLVLLIVASSMLAVRWLPSSAAGITTGIATALLVFTSPVSGLAGAFVWLTWVVMTASTDHTLWRRFGLGVAGGLIGSLFSVLVYPYPVVDWIGGVIRHSRINLALPSGVGFVATWVTRPELPLLLLSFATLALGALSTIVWLIRSQDNSSLWSIPLLVLFGATLVRFALIKTEASYNAVVWMPLFAALALHKRRSAWATWCVIGALMLPVLGIGRSSLVLAGQFRQQAVGFVNVREQIHQLAPLGCDVTPGLWLAVDDVRQVEFVDSHPASARFLVQQETNRGRSTPATVAGYRLVDNHFRASLEMFGVPLGRTAGGWEFAVYERNP